MEPCFKAMGRARSWHPGRPNQLGVRTGLWKWELYCPGIGIAEAKRTAIGPIHRIGGGEAAHGVLGLHLIGLDPPGLEQALAWRNHQGAGVTDGGLGQGWGGAGEQGGQTNQGSQHALQRVETQATLA
jgi:hypothetical protein